jgi:hypothetical protein
MKALSLGSLFIASIYLCACNSSNSNNKAEPSATYNEQSGVITGPVRFDFTASRLVDQPDIVEVKGWLINDLSDTVYYITTSCNGEQNSLVLDTIKYSVVPLWDCEVDEAIIKAIPPLGQYTFEAKLRSTSTEERIRVGFDFFRTERGTAVDGMTYDRIHGNSSKNNILWAEERRFE